MAPTKKQKTKKKRPRTSICQRVRTIKPCERIKSCKVARGTKRTFCRKKRNKNSRKK
jgi:hypothetical protein